MLLHSAPQQNKLYHLVNSSKMQLLLLLSQAWEFQKWRQLKLRLVKCFGTLSCCAMYSCSEHGTLFHSKETTATDCTGAGAGRSAMHTVHVWDLYLGAGSGSTVFCLLCQIVFVVSDSLCCVI